MALIPHAESERIARKAIVLDLGDLQRQADWLRERAEAAAEAYVEEARQERERILAGANEEGFAQGRSEGVERGTAEGREAGRAEAFASAADGLERVAASWSSALDAFERRREDLVNDAKQDLLDLAIGIATRIVHRTIEVDGGVVLDQVESAVALTMGPTRLVIEVNEADREVVEAALPGVMRRLNRSSHTEVVSCDDVDRGGCRVRTTRGVIDATISAQLDRITRTLLPDRSEAGGR